MRFAVFGSEPNRYCFWPGRSDVLCEWTGPYLLLSGTFAALGGELQDSSQCSQPKAEGKNQEHPSETVWLHGWRPGLVCHAAAGPPFAAEVGQLSSLTQLENCHTEVLNDRWACNKLIINHYTLAHVKFISSIQNKGALPRLAAMLNPLMPTISCALTSSQWRATAKSKETDSPIKAKFPSLARRTPSSRDDTKLFVLSMCS